MNARTPTADKISLEALSLRYGSGVQALDSVDLEVETGLFGLLGPNGAGKTTLMKILTTLLKPTGGMARVFGHDVVRDAGRVRSMLGYLPQDFQTYGQLKALYDQISAKMYTRSGMGACQGRTCSPQMKYLFGWDANRVRPPLFPLRVGDLVGKDDA